MYWSESKNLYTNPVLNFVKAGGKPSKDYFESLDEWQTYWRVQDTNSIHSKRLRSQGGKDWARKATTPESLTAADFRLHPTSDGKGDGENGRDLGADVDKVGPGKAYVEWLKSPAFKQWLAATGRDPEPFVVIPADRKKVFPCETLKEAVDTAIAGDIIEVRGNGPYVTEPITITGKALTLRAGNGFAPVIQLSPAGIKAAATLLETNAPLTIEGLEFQRLGADDPKVVQPRKLLESRRSPLFLSHCRFLMNGRESRYAVLAQESPALEVRNSFLNGEFIHALYWLRPPGGRMMVKNNVIAAGHIGLSIQQFGFDSGEASIRLDGNTFMANFTLHYYFDETDAPRKAGVAPMPLTATDNVFQSQRVMSFIRHKKYVPVDFKGAEARLRELLVWQDRRNLYRVPEEYLWYKAFGPVPLEAKGPKDLTNGLSIGKPRTRVPYGNPRYQDLKRPKRRPEDFRSQPGSSRQGRRRNGRDLAPTHGWPRPCVRLLPHSGVSGVAQDYGAAPIDSFFHFPFRFCLLAQSLSDAEPRRPPTLPRKETIMSSFKPRQSRASKSKRMLSLFRPRLEMLEDRLVPALFTWTGNGANDLWSNAANWDTACP